MKKGWIGSILFVLSIVFFLGGSEMVPMGHWVPTTFADQVRVKAGFGTMLFGLAIWPISVYYLVASGVETFYARTGRSLKA